VALSLTADEKRPSAALPSSCVNDVPFGTPYSAAFQAPCTWAFLISLNDEDFSDLVIPWQFH
jgi:hypothetical protein